ncbi:MAG: DUF3365 domain-containing protein [Nitrospirae bacterium]|nr:MAG: DUF3365 domain-containing protein [Nitrospirota bacterium]
MRELLNKVFRLDRLEPKRRFTLLLILIYILSFPLVMGFSYLILKQNAIDHVYETGRLYLASIEAVRHYVSEELRPRLQEELPKKFVREGMSRSYVAGAVARQVMTDLPGYKFKHASLNARSPKNRADSYEADMIRQFLENRDLKEKNDLIERDDGRFYVIARPGTAVKESCLSCHSTPEAAPREIIEIYGAEAGFYMKAGELVDAMFVYIPVGVPLSAAAKTVTYFMAIYTVFFGTVLLIINKRFGWFYTRIESDNKMIEEINSEVLNLNREIEDIVAERTMSMVGLRVADRVRNPITVIGGHCRQLLKTDIDDYVGGKLRDILGECKKMENMIADFDSLLKSKRFQFKREDMNDIVKSTIALLEKPMKEKNIQYSAQLYEKPLMFNANRQLIRISLNHIFNNAIDATPQGGIIAVSTGMRGEKIYLRISDLGAGIANDDINRVFEPFYSTKSRSGMGLPLVRQIVLDHMGEITIDSKEGRGTTVELIFPTRWREQDMDAPNKAQAL